MRARFVVVASSFFLAAATRGACAHAAGGASQATLSSSQTSGAAQRANAGAVAGRALAASGGAVREAPGPIAATSPGPPVRVLLRGCSGMTEREVERVLTAELGTQSLEALPPAAAAPEPTWIVVRCAEGQITVEVNDPLSRKTLLRSFEELALPPRARARLVAIAAAELVLASWAELTLQPSLRVQPLGPSASVDEVQAALARLEAGTGVSLSALKPVTDIGPKVKPWYQPHGPQVRMFHLSLVGSARAFLRHPGALWGGGIRVGDDVLSATSWAADALYESGTLRGTAHEYRVQTWSLGASLLFYHRIHPLTLRAGVGLRVGAVKADSPDRELGTPKNLLVPWGWPMGALSASLRGGSILVEFAAEGSYAAIPAEGGANTPLSGFWLGGQLGLGFIP